MAYYDTINLVAGDTKPEIKLTLKDSNTAAEGLNLDPDDESTWAALDLTDATVSVKFRKLGDTEVLDTLSTIKQAPFTDGICYAQWNATTLQVDAGTYEGEIEITYGDGSVMTLYDKLKFKVRGDF